VHLRSAPTSLSMSTRSCMANPKQPHLKPLDFRSYHVQC
jgi:hypothetical protein